MNSPLKPGFSPPQRKAPRPSSRACLLDGSAVWLQNATRLWGAVIWHRSCLQLSLPAKPSAYLSTSRQRLQSETVQACEPGWRGVALTQVSQWGKKPGVGEMKLWHGREHRVVGSPQGSTTPRSAPGGRDNGRGVSSQAHSKARSGFEGLRFSKPVRSHTDTGLGGRSAARGEPHFAYDAG